METNLSAQELQETKEKIRQKLQEKLQENSQEGVLQYSREVLTGMGVSCQNATVEEIKTVIKELPLAQQEEVLQQLDVYKKAQDEAIKEFQSSKRHSFKKIAEYAVKGAAMGASIAGLVNAAAPGLVPTFCGYLAGKGYGDAIVQLGLVTFGALAAPTTNTAVVLKVAGIAGGAVGGAIGVGKEVVKKVKSRKREMDMSR